MNFIKDFYDNTIFIVVFLVYVETAGECNPFAGIIYTDILQGCVIGNPFSDCGYKNVAIVVRAERNGFCQMTSFITG